MEPLTSRWMRRGALSLAILGSMLPGGSRAGDPKATTPATIRLKAFLRSPDARRFAWVRRDFDRLKDGDATRDESRDVMRRAFEEAWIAPRERPSPLTLDQYTEIVTGIGVQPFGHDNNDLVDILHDRLPSAWDRPEFTDWIRARLPPRTAAGDTLDRLLESVPDDAAGGLDRMAFLLEVSRDQDRSRIRDALATRFERLGAGELARVHEHLDGLDRQGLRRWREAGIAAWSRGLLGDRLFETAPERWTDAGKSLEALIRASSHGPGGFLEKASQVLRTEPGRRTPAGAVLLVRLLALESPSRGYASLDPGADGGWFVWLHERSVIQGLHARDRSLMKSSWDLVRTFCARGQQRFLFGPVREHYYRAPSLQEEAFTALIRPWARGPFRREIYQAARSGTFSVPHRTVLGTDLLADDANRPHEPAWPGGPGRIHLALELYRALVHARSPLPDLSRQLESPLLAVLVEALMSLHQRSETHEELVLDLVGQLAAEMVSYRRRGARTGACVPLRRLHDELARRVEETLDALPRPSDSGGEPGREAQRAIDRFVKSLAVAFRLTGAVERALGTRATWFDRILETLRQRVFGLPAAPVPGGVHYWSEPRTRFAAGLLAKLDPALRDCLETIGTPDQWDRVWSGLLLPLARVHGLLRVLKENARDPDWAHLAWIRSSRGPVSRQRLEDFFGSLQECRWIDGDDAVLDLAREHLAGLDRNIWEVPPDRIFAGRWSASANLRVHRRLLGDRPREGGPWVLDRIARQTLETLKVRPPPRAPAFPLSGPAPPPARDELESVWEHAAWTLGVVTAAEWWDSPFRDEHGRPIAAHRLLTFTGSPDGPFEFRPPPAAASRRVDGRLRADLAGLLTARAASPGSSIGPARPILLARVAMFLPNAPDNIAGDERSLKEFATIRQGIYARLQGLLQDPKTLPDPDREAVFRAMMWLDASARTERGLQPDFETVVTRKFLASSQEPERAGMVVEDILAEHAELELRARCGAGGTPLPGAGRDASRTAVPGPPCPDGPDAARGLRISIDRTLAAYGLTDPCQPDEDLRHRNWRRRLEALGETRVLQTLRLRGQLDALLASHRPEDTAGWLQDLGRIAALLDVIDDTIFYSRPDFDVDQVERFVRPLPRAGGGSWRPALTVLAWCDGPLQDRITAHCWNTGGRRPPEAARLVECLRHHLVRLNEGVFLTIRTIAEGDVGDPRTIFEDLRPYRIEHRMLDFRLLAETLIQEEASGETLARDCFRGVLTNLRIGIQGRPPNDRDLLVRLFGADEGHDGRSSFHVDRIVRFADRVSGRSQLPVALRKGASRFLSGGATGLLDHAATVGGVLAATDRILETIESPDSTPGHRRFYDRRLAGSSGGAPRLSPGFEHAVAAPFFRGAGGRQREDAARILDFWRQLHGPAAGGAPDLRRALSGDLGRVLGRLVRGEDRPPGADSIWEPVQALAGETGVRPAPPDRFFEVARWWIGLGRDSDPETIRALFRLPDPGMLGGSAP